MIVRMTYTTFSEVRLEQKLIDLTTRGWRFNGINIAPRGYICGMFTKNAPRAVLKQG